MFKSSRENKKYCQKNNIQKKDVINLGFPSRRVREAEFKCSWKSVYYLGREFKSATDFACKKDINNKRKITKLAPLIKL